MRTMIQTVLAAALLTAGAATAAAPAPQERPAATVRPLFAVVYRAGPAWSPACR
jgi:uncharacterized protein